MGGATLTCLLISDTKASREVVDQLQEWADGRLLNPFVVLRRSRVENLESRSPLVRGDYTGVGRPADVDLMRLLAEGTWERVLFVALFDVGMTEQGDSLSGVGARLAGLIKSRMPTNAESTEAGPVAFSSIRLVAPMSGGAAFPGSTVLPSPIWTDTVVLAPEDRLRPDGAADLVRWPGNYASHVAGAIASLAGLWLALADEPPPILDGADDAQSGGTAVRVVRVNSRIVTATLDVKPLVEESMRVALGVADYPVGTPVRLRRRRRIASEQLIARAAHRIADDPSQTLAYRGVEGDEDEQPVDIGPSRLIDSYWRFIFGAGRRERKSRDGSRQLFAFRGALVEPVQAAWLSISGRAKETMQETFIGQGTDYRLRVGGALPAEMARIYGEQAQVLKERMERADQAPAIEDVGAGYWPKLRQETFGLVDGGGTAEQAAGSEVFDVVGPRGLLAPEMPAPHFAADTVELLGIEEEEILPFDVWSRSGALLRLEQVVADLRGTTSEPDGPKEPEEAEEPAPQDDGVRPTRWKLRFALLAVAVVAGAAALASAAAGAGRWQVGGLAAVSAVFLMAGVLAARRKRPKPGQSYGLGYGAQGAAGRQRPKALGWTHPYAVQQVAVRPEWAKDEDLIGALENDLTTGRQWLERVKPTFLGIIAHRTAALLDKTLGDSVEMGERYRSIQKPSWETLQRARRRWFLTFWSSLVLAPLGIYLLSRAWRSDATTALEFTGIEFNPDVFFPVLMVLWLLLLALLWVWAIINYKKAFLQSMRTLRKNQHELALVGARMSRASHERGRLIAINYNLAKWLEVLAWVTRYPYDVPGGHGVTQVPLVAPGPSQEPASDRQDEASQEDGPAAAAAAGAGAGEGATDGAGESGAPTESSDEPQPDAPAGDGPPVDRPSHAGPPADERRHSGTPGESGPAADALPSRAVEAIEPALGARLGRPVVSSDFREAERRRAVARSVGRGWLGDYFTRLVEASFSSFGLAPEAVLGQMDKDTTGATSYLDQLIRILRAGDYRRAAEARLEQGIASHRATLTASSGSGFSALRLSGDARSRDTVRSFIGSLAGPGTAFQPDSFRGPSLARGMNELRECRLWAPLDPEDGGQRLTAHRIEVKPDPQQVQLATVRVDSTARLEPKSLNLFDAAADPRATSSESLPGYDSEDLV